MFDAGKTRMIGLPYGEKKCMGRYAKPFSSDTGTLRTDEPTDLLYQCRASSRVSMLTRDKKTMNFFAQ